MGGEKEGAQKKLQQLMKKYDIEESDLSDDKLEDHEWKYHNDFELRLLKQTIYKVLGTVIKDYAFTITTRQDRTPAQVIDCGGGRFRYLTELECWRLQGYTDEDFERAKAVHKRAGRYYTALYKQAGNSIAVPIFESIFRKIILNETA